MKQTNDKTEIISKWNKSVFNYEYLMRQNPYEKLSYLMDKLAESGILSASSMSQIFGMKWSEGLVNKMICDLGSIEEYQKRQITMINPEEIPF